MNYVISWLLVFLSFNLFCQQRDGEITINGKYTDIPFSQFVINLEAKHPIHFYYAEEWVDSLLIHIEAKDLPLEDFLDEVFRDTDIRFFINQNQIILSKGFSIYPQLASKKWTRAQELPPIRLGLFEQNKEPEAESSLTNIENKLVTIGVPSQNSAVNKASLGGYVKDSKNGAPIAGVSVVIPVLSLGTITDDFGYYVLNIPKGEYEIQYKFVGRKETKRKVLIQGDGQLSVEMDEEIIALKEVVITGEKSKVESVQTGLAKLNLEEINTIPTVLGEADIMKISLTLPGVQSVGEGAVGFNVRGGTTDQNLILLDDALIYNPNHLFGFFSAFNPDVIKHVDLYKSGLQAHYGGRISSVFDVAIRDGNKKKFIAAGGISPITSKITLEGPIQKENSSFILGVRSTYSNWLLRLLDDPVLNNSEALFRDIIGKINHQLNENNNLQFSIYHSRDRFKLNADTLYRYVNSTSALRWRHVFNNKMHSLVSGSFSQYAYEIESAGSLTNAFKLDYKLSQANLKTEINLHPNSQHQLKMGLQSVLYQLRPGGLRPLGEKSFVKSLVLNKENGWENALFIGNEYTVSARLSLYGGFRFSSFSLIGPGEVFKYLPASSREVEFISDTLSYNSGAFIKSYGGPEYRFSARYKLAEELSVKFSYDKTRQYIHRLSNTISISPTDTWRLSNTYIKPQVGDQLAVGIYKNVPTKGLEFTIEGYYKFIQNLLEYKDGAELLINEALETDVINVKGRAFGVELLVKKKSGRFNGWVSYTYSRSLVQAKSVFPQEQINAGKYFPSNFDKPHNLSIITNYKFSRRVNISCNFAYSSGRPVTLPITKYQFAGNILAFFSQRNEYRIPDYLRLDVALNLEGNHKIKKLGHSSWAFSIYNLTGRNNPYSVFARVNNGNIGLFQLSVFSRPIPTLTYNFEIR